MKKRQLTLGLLIVLLVVLGACVCEQSMQDQYDQWELEQGHDEYERYDLPRWVH